MDQEIIFKILKHYQDNLEYEENLHSAFHYFFNTKECFFEPSEEDNFRFYEWLVYDYILPNKKNLIKDYLSKNFDNLTAEEIEVCKDLLNNIFSIFEVKKVWQNEKIKLKDLFSKKEYIVKEKLGSRELSEKSIIVCRICKLKDHFEIVSAVANALPFNLDESITKNWKKDEKFDLKMIYDLFFSKKEKKIRKDKFPYGNKPINPQKAKDNFENFLKKSNLDDFVSSELVQKWIYNSGYKNSLFKTAQEIIFVLMGLIVSEESHSNLDPDELVRATINFYNTCPQKTLKGKSPEQKSQEQEKSKSQIIISSSKFSPEDFECFNEAIRLMHIEKYKLAQKTIEDGLGLMLKKKLVLPDIYRPFANLGVCFLAQQKIMEAEMFVDLALKLNPNYGFAKKVKKNFSVKEMPGTTKKAILLIKKDIERNLKRQYKKHPAMLYFDFLKKTEINFVTKEPTKDHPMILGRKISRNEPCPCGSKRKYKKCCGQN